MRAFKIISAILLAGGVTRADYHYASHQGSDESPYTSWETAAALIQDAVSAASPHDTVYIGTGDYHERVVIPIATTHLGIMGMGWENTRIWYDVQGQHVMQTSDSCLVEDIHFQHLMRGVGLESHFYTNLLTVRNCKFSGQEREGGGIITSFTGSSLIVEDCVFYDGRGIDAAMGRPPFMIVKNCLFDLIHYSAIYAWGGRLEIERNICTRASTNLYEGYSLVDTMIFMNNLSLGNYGTILDGSLHSWDIIDNNVSIDGFDIYGAFEFDPVYDLRAYNNIIMGHGIGMELYIRGEQDSADLRYNNLVNGVEDINVWYYENIDTSVIYHEYPIFVGDGDYHLQAFSPLIDAGNPEILDVDGTRSDVGAYGGPLGESYEYVDLPPLAPDSFVYTVYLDSVVFNWRMNREADFAGYLIHRDTVSGFEPGESNLIAEPESSQFVDGYVEFGQTYYYRIASLDNQGNLSDYSVELAVEMTGIWDDGDIELPRITAIESNYPNPFNSQTTIVYSVADLGPVPAQIDIDIYDVLGRKLRTLVNELKEVGVHRVEWDGRDETGAEMPSGVYFAKISQWGISVLHKPKKLILIR